MSYATKFNNGTKFSFRTSGDVNYVSLETLYTNDPNKMYDVKALYINKKSKFGDTPVVVVDSNTIVNLPKHMLDTVNNMISDNECVEAINNGEVFFKIYQYEDTTFHKTCYSIEWL